MIGINQNIQDNQNVESFHQIQQSHPFRRNQSQILNSNYINQHSSYKFSQPNEIPQQKELDENPIKIKKIIKNEFPPERKTLTKSQSSINIKRGFNPKNHIPPQFDIYGYLKPIKNRKGDMSILDNKDNIKIPWCTKNSNKSGAMTRSELIEIRKKEKIPDISYDLDKDGYVGGRDYVISKRYDIDNDGKLNEQEKKAAYEGLSQNIEENYIWNVDNQGGRRAFRLLQKRGKIIDAEDFWPIRETYPEHPISKLIPRCASLTELKKLRKEENIKQINHNLSEYEKNNPNKLIYSSIDNNANNDKVNDNDDYNDNIQNLNKPLYTSMEQIRKEKNRNARIKCGLNPEASDVRDIKKHPGLEYIYNPIYKTKKDLNDAYRKENLEESKKLSNIKHKSDVERLNEREDEIFAKLYSNKEGLTYSKIKNEKRKQINDYNIKTFSKQTIGVHGHELPKFSESETNKEFWKLKEGYCENPKFKSQCEYLESIKYYKPPGEELLLNEHRDEEPNWIDPFKMVHVLEAKNKKENLITKVNNINIFKNFDPNNPKPIDPSNYKQHIYRWTTLVNQFAPNKFKKGRYFDSIPEEDKYKKNENEQNSSKLKLFNEYFSQGKKSTTQSANGKENGNVALEILPKDCLFQKYSTKDQNKNTLSKNTMVRTQGF